MNILRAGSNGTTGPERRSDIRGKDPFFDMLARNGCSILTNPHNIESREQSLKDTWFGFYKIYCCKNGQIHDGRPLRDQSSGNFPKYFPGVSLARVREPMKDAVGRSRTGAYMAGVAEAREAVAQYYSVPPTHLFFSAGISDGIEMIHKVFLNNTKAKVLLPNESYPTHFSTAVMFGGRDLVVTVPRDHETGYPDFGDVSGGHNPFSQVGFSSFIPYGNPNPVVYPESFFRNDRGTGAFDLNEAATMNDPPGSRILRPVVLDMIYESFSWPERHMRVRRLIELSDEKNILIFVNSLSKVFLEPNKKAGVVAVYIPDRLRKYAEGSIVRDLESDFQRRLGVIPNCSMEALVAAHRILASDILDPDPELEMIRREGRRRFIGEDGKGGNQAVMRSLPHIKPLHPAVKIESSGYNLFFIDHPDVPWKKTEYKAVVMEKLKQVILQIPDEDRRLEAMSAFDYYMRSISVAELAPSDIFCLDLVMETGVAFAPVERFYKLGTAPSVVAFRPVMVAENDQFAADARLVSEFLVSKLGG
ncbi:MAG: hypothetical protein U0R44_01405 [Candidatus Micrarchaeia archaeon]